jgi:coenzyme F420-dependent glucose-6-phosphate dehydrogenase
VDLGFHCSHEQHSPAALLNHAKRAADAGFTHAMCSDHLAPWSERQGHSGFTWSWLGAALEATPLSFGTVCAPGQRYHPVIIAQATATLAEMYGDRFWVALGSGEALNEAITGDPWPPRDTRRARLRECADVIRALWAGETVSSAGHVTVRDARIYVRPSSAPLLIGAAISAETARWVGEWADGLITVARPREELRQVVDAFRESGGSKPMFLQVALSYAPTDEAATAAAMDQWRQAALSADQIADLASPAEFDDATRAVEPSKVLASVRTSSDIRRHLEWLREDAALGFDRVFVHNVARDHQERFIDECGRHLLPQFAA